MIAAALLPPLVFLVFVAIWRVAALFILLLRATREDRQPIDVKPDSIYTASPGRTEAFELLEKARLEDERRRAPLPIGQVTMDWPPQIDYLAMTPDQYALEVLRPNRQVGGPEIKKVDS